MDEEDDETQPIAESIAMVEYYFKVHIKGDYPIMKRFNQQENLPACFKLDLKRFGLGESG